MATATECTGSWGYHRPIDGGYAAKCSGCDTWLILMEGEPGLPMANGHTLQEALADYIEAKQIKLEAARLARSNPTG